MMLQLIIGSLLLGIVLASWGLQGLNPFQQQSSSQNQISPRRDYSTQQSNIERLLNVLDPFPSMQQLSYHLPVDIRETQNGIDIQIDIPGVDKNEISVTIHRNNELQVKAHKEGLQKSQDSEMWRQERYWGEVSRTIVFPDYVDLENLEAKYEDGVLWLKIPKKIGVEAVKPKNIAIKFN